MERLLKESETRFRSMFENSPVAYLALDDCNRCLDLNLEFCRLLGYEREEIRGKNLADFCPPDKRDASVEQLTGLKDNGSLHAELELVHKDTGLLTVIVEGRVQPDAEGQPFRMHCIVDNITDRKRIEEQRKQAEQALLEHNALQSALLSAIPAYVYIKDNNSVYLVGNKRFSELSGVPENEIAGKTDYDFFSAADAESFRRNDAEIFAAGEAKLNYEMKGIQKDGQTVWYSTSKSPFYNSSGTLAGLVGICIDITDQKRLEEERLQFERRIQHVKKTESLSCMAGSIAHNFNNLLAVVMGNLELAIENTTTGGRSSEYLNDAMQASMRAADISGLMLTYLGQIHSSRAFLDLSAFISKNIAQFKNGLSQGADIQIEIPPPGLVIKADADLLRDILTNLITNARESIGESQGIVRLSVKKFSREGISMPHRFPFDWQPIDHSYACIAIEDSGCGIADENIDKLFDPFFSSKFTGRGLGLPVVLGIVKAHEGVVTVESEIEKGSVFRVFLPIAENEQS
ncbi:MAG: PAS domain S-box protein [Desulfocapsaceae bacterium]|nr:PAS domain S-box protein [Desulfocapsaceae bacterium]